MIVSFYYFYYLTAIDSIPSHWIKIVIIISYFLNYLISLFLLLSMLSVSFIKIISISGIAFITIRGVNYEFPRK